MRRILLLLVLLASFVAAPVGTRAQSADELFRQALVRERTDGDLQGAIELFERVARSTSDRSLAAQALVRVGQNYERLGQERALDAYRRIVSGYSDQAEEVRVARERLAALARPAAGPLPAEPFSRTAVNLPEGFDWWDLSPDGESIAATSKRGDLVTVDIASGEVNTVVPGEANWAQSLRFSPDGSTIGYVSRNAEHVASLMATNLTSGVTRTVLDLAYLPDVSDKSFDPHVLDWTRDGTQMLTYVWAGTETKGYEYLLLVPLDASAPTVLGMNEAVRGWTGERGCLSGDDRYAFLDYAEETIKTQFVMRFDLRTGSRVRWRTDDLADVALVGCPDGTSEVLYSAERYGGRYLFAGPADSDPIAAQDDRTLMSVESDFNGFATSSHGDVLDEGGRNEWYRIVVMGMGERGEAAPESEIYRGVYAWLGGWDPSGTRFLYAVNWPRELRVWDSTTGETASYPLPSLAFRTRLQWMPDGRRIVMQATSSETKTDSVSVFDLFSRTFTPAFTTGNRSIHPGADGSSLLVWNRDSPNCWDRLSLDGTLLGRFFCLEGVKGASVGLSPISDFSGYGLQVRVEGEPGARIGFVDADGSNARLTSSEEHGRAARQQRVNARTWMYSGFDPDQGVTEVNRLDVTTGEQQTFLSTLHEYMMVNEWSVRPDETMAVVSAWAKRAQGLTIIHNVLGGAAQK